MNLYLFDVDGTMLNVDHIHEQAYAEMYPAVFGKKFELCLPHGEERTTHNIIKCAMKEDVPGVKIEAQMNEAIENMVRLYMSRVNPLFVHTNVSHVIEKLSESGMVAVFTGGARAVTNVILKKTELYSKFQQISTCDDASTRKEIIKHAIENASLGVKFDKIFVIGDTPEDITAAKANNAISVVVTLGNYDADDLKNADIILKDWTDTDDVLEQLK